MRDYLAERNRLHWMTRHPVRLCGKPVICGSFVPLRVVCDTLGYWAL